MKSIAERVASRWVEASRTEIREERIVFGADIHASDIQGLGGPDKPVVRAVVQGLIDEWTEGAPMRRGHGPRIGTLYGMRSKDGTFSIRIDFRHAGSVEASMKKGKALEASEIAWYAELEKLYPVTG